MSLYAMKTRTLVCSQNYFGLEALVLRRGAERVLARGAGQPPENARVNAQTLGEDFRLDAATAHALLLTLVSHRLLEPERDRAGDYRLTERFREIAAARVVRPLQRWQARELLEAAGRLVAQMNADSARNPFMVEMMAVSGSYMSRSNRIGELVLWPLVKPRHQKSARRIRSSLSETEGAKEIRTALRALSPFIVVNVVTDATSIARPFSVPFRADDNAELPAPPAVGLLAWGLSLRRQLIGR
jgi:hypothetical protein